MSRIVVWLLAALGCWLLAFWGAVALQERPLATGALMALAFCAGYVVKDRICFRKCPCYPKLEGWSRAAAFRSARVRARAGE